MDLGDMIISFDEYAEMEKEIERLKEENERLRKQLEIYCDV